MITVADQSSQHDVTSLDRLERVLDRWRGRIDRLLVQADLAAVDPSDEVRRAAHLADDAWRAAAQRLHGVPEDAGPEIGSRRSAVGKLLVELGQAYQSAEAAVRRSRTGK